MAGIRPPNALRAFDNNSMEISKNENRHAAEFIVMKYIAGDTLHDTIFGKGFYFK